MWRVPTRPEKPIMAIVIGWGDMVGGGLVGKCLGMGVAVGMKGDIREIGWIGDLFGWRVERFRSTCS